MDVLLILLIIFLFAALPTLPYSASGRTRYEHHHAGEPEHGVEPAKASSQVLRSLFRVVQSSGPLRLAIVEGLDVRDSWLSNVPRRYNAAPSQKLLVIRQNRKTGERSLDLLKWGLIPYWCSDPLGGRRPINAKAESVSRLPSFRDAYAQRRCIVPVDGFFEWRAIRGARGKQPYAIAMKDDSPFGPTVVAELA